MKWLSSVWEWVYTKLAPVCWFCEETKLPLWGAYKLRIQSAEGISTHKVCQACLVSVYKASHDLVKRNKNGQEPV